MSQNRIGAERQLVSPEVPTIGVVIVTYNSSDVIWRCLESLISSDHAGLRIVICDNASPDDTPATVRRWAAKRGREVAVIEPSALSARRLSSPAPDLMLLCARTNRGFAAGVNLGLKALLPYRDTDLFWILNPDAAAAPNAATAYARAALEGPFALIGGRVLYEDPPNLIQSDGGRVSRWTGICRNVNQGAIAESVSPPRESTLDFISGANLVASRAFIEKAGPMPEDYFLYYEEVEWATRRGDLPIKLCSEARVFHRGGTAIGTGSITRRATAFANYFNYRNRLRFIYRINPIGIPVAYAASILRVVRMLTLGAWDEAIGAVRGLHQLPPSKAIRERLSPGAADVAFGRRH